MTLKLFYAPGACSLAPHVALHWSGTPFEAIRVKYGSPELVAINPAGAVPALDTGEGWTLTQAGAILHYIARRFPDAGLGAEPGLRGEADFDRWSSFFTGDLHPAFFPLFSPGRYTVSKEVAAQDQVREAARALVARRLKLLDAYALPMLRWASAKLPEGLAPYPAVRAHLERMLADPGVAEIIASEEAS